MTNLQEDSRWWDATETAEAVRTGELTASESIEAAIQRIEAGDSALNSVVLDWFDHARSLVADLPDGPLRGVPFLLKDLWVQYEGQARTDGNTALAADPPVATIDSLLVSRTKEAGLVTLGRSASPEMGSIPVTETAAHGATRNPWDTDRTPGGSSGGAAAAVAAGFVPVAHASDGGGSIRIPASCCGLVGLKPSQGRVSMQGHGIETGLGIDFCVSRTVRDSALMLDLMHGPGVGDTIIAPPPEQPYLQTFTQDPGSLRVGILDSQPMGGALHDACAEAVRKTATALEQLGHAVEVDHPSSLDDPSTAPTFMAMWAAGRRAGIATMEAALGRSLTESDIEPHNWAQAMAAEKMSAWDYVQSLAAVAQFRRATQQWWADGWDVLVTPTLAAPPLRIGEITEPQDDPMAAMQRASEWVAYTAQFNATGQPAISLPLHWTADGLPIGVQLVAAYGREDLLLQVAAQLESALPWSDRRPPLFDIR